MRHLRVYLCILIASVAGIAVAAAAADDDIHAANARLGRRSLPEDYGTIVKRIGAWPNFWPLRSSTVSWSV
jgi:hypothetical protein